MSPRVLPASVLMPEYEALLRQGAELPYSRGDGAERGESPSSR